MANLQSQILLNVIYNLDKATCDAIINTCEQRKKQIDVDAMNKLREKIHSIIDLWVNDILLRKDHKERTQLMFTYKNRKYYFDDNTISFQENHTTTVLYCKNGKWSQQLFTHTLDKSIPGPIDFVIDMEALHIAKIRNYRDELYEYFTVLKN